ncbi:hypothetical protein HY357_02025 [Candidatus Roizmanbacteria bacterium]|nr:hypothetical protein [Candidatus Roizmanbacteria bacterium]
MKETSKKKVIKTLLSSDVLMSPRKVIERMENIIEKYGISRAIKSVAFQKAREAWVASIFMLGMSQLSKKTYWIQENSIAHEAPDIVACSYRNPTNPQERGVVKEIQPIEVSEYTKYSNQVLPLFIKKKLKDKFYHEETIVVCYVRKPGYHLKIMEIINQLSDLSTSVREVWILFTTDKIPLSNFTIARVYLRGKKQSETMLAYKGDYLKLCMIPQADFLRDSRGHEKIVRITKSGEFAIVPLPPDLK